MKHVSTLALALSAAVLLGSNAKAQDRDGPRGYINFGGEIIGLSDFDDRDFNIFPDSASNVVIRGGLDVTRHIAVEADVAFGADGDDADVDYGNRFAGFARLRLPNGDDRFEVFVKLGFASTELDGDRTEGVAYGGGFAFHFGDKKRHGVRLDYTRYEFGDGLDGMGQTRNLGSEGTTLAYVLRF